MAEVATLLPRSLSRPRTPLTADDDEVEETTVESQTSEAATGGRLVICLVMAVVTFALVPVGVLGATHGWPAWVAAPLVVGGLLLAAAFALAAAGSEMIGLSGKGFHLGARLPRERKVRTLVRRHGLPRHGKSPAERRDSRRNGR